MRDDLYVGMKKKYQFTTTKTSSCHKRERGADIAAFVQWMTAPNEAVPSLFFNSSNTDFDSCSDMYIFVKRVNGSFQYGDDQQSVKRKFLCVKEAGKFLNEAEFLNFVFDSKVRN